ncbi:MAG: RidA family protein [Pseudomonadota bacterium]
MTMSFDARLATLGLLLPDPPKSVANYVATSSFGNLLIVSGQLCIDSTGKLVAKGQAGTEVGMDQAVAAARAAAINVLAQTRAALGSLDRVTRVHRLGGFIAAPVDFADHARIMNGASDLMVEVFGAAGRHARSTIGVSSLPLQATVEVEAIIEFH